MNGACASITSRSSTASSLSRGRAHRGRRGQAQETDIDIALARTGLRWRPMPVNGALIRFSLNQVDGCLRLDAWSGDAGLLPRSELEYGPAGRRAAAGGRRAR